jgi:hypothetical protein
MSTDCAALKELEKVTVSATNVLRRVNRKLAQKNQQLRAYRSHHNGLSPFYHFDAVRNVTICEHVDLEQFARDLGVLADNEVIGIRPISTDASSQMLAARAPARPVRTRPFRLRVFPPPEDE